MPEARARSTGAKRRRSIKVLRKIGYDFFKQTPPRRSFFRYPGIYCYDSLQ